MLEIKNLSIHYIGKNYRVKAVENVSFNLTRGELLGIVGESGSGKTTLIRSIMGVNPQSAKIVSGEIFYKNNKILDFKDDSIKGDYKWKEIAFIPQSAMNSLDPVYRIIDQMREILIVRGDYNKKTADKRSEELFSLVGIEKNRLRDFPHQFSGGMKQRVAIAMALALDPKIVIADEPVTALDVIVQRQILDLFNELRNRLNLSIILVTHDVSVVAYLCHKVAVMYDGEIVETGPVKDILEKPYHPYTIGLNNAFPDLHSTNDFLEPISDSLFHELDELKNTFNSLSLKNEKLVKSDKFVSLKKKFTKLNTQNEKNN
ncbi:ABC transporter ATP-binding protein [Alphaproteobacteria bacterium]|mgnify:FL=1|jgi:peptide/nickel transport system ATP-binding protein|nr:ABC transporter ATP-binding protein [Alphaproteobacteria bacterium]|tara:strand:+ start:411 stop:1361 length:951 start_codon:yes stop_codon:yes gene_type:complete